MHSDLGTGVGAAQAGVLLIGGLTAFRAGATIAVNNAETDAQVNAAQASYERRQQEWRGKSPRSSPHQGLPYAFQGSISMTLLGLVHALGTA
jgi:hypothetical protein